MKTVNTKSSSHRSLLINAQGSCLHPDEIIRDLFLFSL